MKRSYYAVGAKGTGLREIGVPFKVRKKRSNLQLVGGGERRGRAGNWSNCAESPRNLTGGRQVHTLRRDAERRQPLREGRFVGNLRSSTLKRFETMADHGTDTKGGGMTGKTSKIRTGS